MISFEKDLALVEELFEILFPINRSITGNGVRETLKILNDVVPIKINEVKCGTNVFDWKIPDEWNINDGWIKIFEKIKIKEEIKAVKQKSMGRLFLTRDFHPSHLRVIYGTFDNKIVDNYLDRTLDQRKPKLIKLF
tara:strand:+ start:199 stop:606 length:408 start_codon:yes stop_codon:yes gene_type:complete